MSQMLSRFWKVNVYVKIILVFCVYGLLVNSFAVLRDIRTDGVLFRLHLGFLLLYAGQAAFILLREKWVSVLTVLQAALALGSNLDFTFMPLLGFAGRIYAALCPNLTVEGLAVYKYVLVSLSVTAQLASAWILWMDLPVPVVKKTAQPPEEKKPSVQA